MCNEEVLTGPYLSPFLLQLQQANDECNSAEERGRLARRWQSSSWLAEGAVGVSGQPLETVANSTAEYDTTKTNVYPVWIYSHTLTCTGLLDVRTDHSVKKAYKSDYINDSFNIQCEINNS